MSVFRVSMSFPFDSTLPKDVITINPHFNGDDAQTLLTALSNNLKAWAPVAASPFTLKAYDASKAPPNYPLATVAQAGTPPTSGGPREVALCLSYYTTYNRPRYRGRLYLPNTWITASMNVRPNSAMQQVPIDFAKLVLTKALPAATTWVVYSKRDNRSQGTVTDVWVDNEWDTIRSRGLAPTSRVTGTV